MDEYTAIVVAERILAFVIFAVIVHLLVKPEKKKTNFYLALTAASSFIGLVADSLTYQQESWGGLDFPYAVNYIIYFLSFTTYIGVVLFFMLYCKEYIEERTNVNKWVFRTPIIACVLSYIYQVVNIIQGKVFYYDGVKFVVASNSLSPVILMITIASAIYLPLVILVKAKEIGKRVSVLFAIAIIFPLASLSADFVNGQNVDYSPVTAALGIFISYLFIQNKQEYETTENRKMLEQHQKELERLYGNLQKAQKDIDDYIEKLLAERQAKEDYYRLSRFDITTEVYRKAVFLDEAKVYLELNKDASAGVIFLDIDNFKMVNDTLGHIAGDDVIIKIANILRTSVANKDIIGRYGGDEFVILMKEITKEKLLDKLNFLHQKTQFSVVNEDKELPVTCCLGAVYCNAAKGNVTIEKLINQADQCLYSAKGAGKNAFQCVDYEESI